MLTNRQKRIIKWTCKLMNAHQMDRLGDLPKIKGLIHAAKVTSASNHPESWRLYAIFDRGRVRLGELYGEISRLVDPEGNNRAAQADHSPTGWFYAERARVRIFPDRVVLIQAQGFDC
ncbi:MAG: hypothetical protein M0Z41_10750 [Peptococcaceae bacterium]|jgi:hypothetical protein|nr:hypothetical protein [Peptococcaceae bacterium]